MSEGNVAEGSALNETENIIKLYMHAVGVTQQPSSYHLWSCLALISAAASNRVGIGLFHGKLIHPDIYLMLEGPSGISKGEAVDLALSYVKDNPAIPTYIGRTTAPALIDFLEATGGRLFLVMEEMKACLGGRDISGPMIAFLTALFGSKHFDDNTRKGGHKSLPRPCITALLGSTMVWLRECVAGGDVEGGFFGRMVIVREDYNFARRVRIPRYAPDIDEVKAYLKARFEAITHLAGTFEMTPEADRAEDQWFSSRPEPADRLLAPWWQREHTLLRKIAMLLALADGFDLVIQVAHVKAAEQLLVARGADMLSVLQEVGSSTGNHDSVTFIADYLRHEKRVLRTFLMQHCARRKGMKAQDVNVAIDTLVQSGLVEATKSTGKSMWYAWVDGGGR